MKLTLTHEIYMNNLLNNNTVVIKRAVSINRVIIAGSTSAAQGENYSFNKMSALRDRLEDLLNEIKKLVWNI